MSLHINRLLDRIKMAEGRQQRDITLTVSEARDLHADITRLLLALQVLQEQPQVKSQASEDIQVSGGTF